MGDIRKALRMLESIVAEESRAKTREQLQAEAKAAMAELLEKVDGLQTCEYCNKRPALKTDAQERWVCKTCLNSELKEQPHRVLQRVGRNHPCPCKSGKKFKHCCLGK